MTKSQLNKLIDERIQNMLEQYTEVIIESVVDTIIQEGIISNNSKQSLNENIDDEWDNIGTYTSQDIKSVGYIDEDPILGDVQPFNDDELNGNVTNTRGTILDKTNNLPQEAQTILNKDYSRFIKK